MLGEVGGAAIPVDIFFKATTTGEYTFFIEEHSIIWYGVILCLKMNLEAKRKKNS